MTPYEDLSALNAFYADDIHTAIKRVIKSGHFILGNETESFEREFSNFLDAKHCIGVGNGLDALTLAIKSLNFPAGSQIIVQSNTYIATVLSIISNDLVPIFVEPDLSTYGLKAEKIADAISSSTRAILITHLYGKISDMYEIRELGQQYGLSIIEDCAQSHGSCIEGKQSGTFGDIGCFSFYPTKNLGALGDGGAIVTDNDEIANQVRRLRNYGSSRKYLNEVVGVNSRLDEIQAAVLRAKLKHLPAYLKKKNSLAQVYFENLNPEIFSLPKIESGKYDTFHIFPIRSERRDEIRTYLAENGIGSEIHYPISLNRQPALNGMTSGDFRLAEEISRTILSLPCSIIHTSEQIKNVCRVLNGMV